MPKLTAEQLQTIINEAFPEHPDNAWRIECVEDMHVRVRLPFQASSLRPGGTISGPTLVALADIGMYAAVLAMIGPVMLAVTTSLNINFMRKAEPGDILADCRLLKLGNRLAVGEVALFPDGADEMIAHATLTYSIPPREQRPA